MARPSVKSAIRDDGGHVTVEFRDGHYLTFVYNHGGWGESTNIEAIRLEKGSGRGRNNRSRTTVVEYVSPYQYPKNRFDVGLHIHDDGYDLKRFRDYALAARGYSARRAKNGDRATYGEIYKAHNDLADLKAGKVKIVKSKK